MTQQLNTRISDADHLALQLLQEKLRYMGVNMNQRQLIEYMIMKTYNDVNKALEEGKGVEGLW